jgi:hypothetical protein
MCLFHIWRADRAFIRLTPGLRRGKPPSLSDVLLNAIFSSRFFLRPFFFRPFGLQLGKLGAF